MRRPYSFYPGKNLGRSAMPEPSPPTTRNWRTACARLRNYGSKDQIPARRSRAINSRLDELQAAFLRVKLRHLDEWNARRSKIAAIYLGATSDLSSQLFSVSGLQLLPLVPSWASPVWHLFVIRHPQRDDLQQKLTEAGIGTLIHYPVPPHLSSAYSALRASGIRRLEPALGGDTIANTVLSLPIGPHLTEEHAKEVVAKLNECLVEINR